MSAARKSSVGLTIGTVLTILKQDFPGISISKIRFLENEGLVQPQRSTSGYRLFSNEDVERLRLILAAQRDAYLPLKVIAEKLDDGSLSVLLAKKEEESATDVRRLRSVPMSAGEQAVAAVGPSGDQASLPSDELPGSPITKSQLLGLTGLDATTLSRIESAELLTTDKLGRYAPQSVPICRAAEALMRNGIDERHWGPFRAAASRESGSIEGAVAHKTDSEARAAAVAELIESFTTMHHWLLTAALSD